MSKLDPTRANAPFAGISEPFRPADTLWAHDWSPGRQRLTVALASRTRPFVWGRVNLAVCPEGQAERGPPWPMWQPWVVHSSALEAPAFSQGWGTAMYLEAFADLARGVGHTTVGNDWCCGGSTSVRAQQVWWRLARLFPQAAEYVADERGSGGCMWIKLAPRAVLTAQRQWAARMAGRP